MKFDWVAFDKDIFLEKEKENLDEELKHVGTPPVGTPPVAFVVFYAFRDRITDLDFFSSEDCAKERCRELNQKSKDPFYLAIWKKIYAGNPQQTETEHKLIFASPFYSTDRNRREMIEFDRMKSFDDYQKVEAYFYNMQLRKEFFLFVIYEVVRAKNGTKFSVILNQRKIML